MLRITRFPYDYEATHFLASPQLQTPWLVFQDEWHNTSQMKKQENVTKIRLNKIIPSMPCQAVTIWFQVLFTP